MKGTLKIFKKLEFIDRAVQVLQKFGPVPIDITQEASLTKDILANSVPELHLVQPDLKITGNGAILRFCKFTKIQ